MKWKTTDVGSGYWRLSPIHATDKAMEVAGWSTSNGGNIQIWAYGSQTSQKFQISSYDGYYRLINQNSGKCVDIDGASTADGANVFQWTCGSQTNQQFSFISAKSDDVEPATGNAFSIYPNPATSGNFILNLPYFGNQSIEISIIDMQGKAIYQETMAAKAKLEIAQELAKGIYLVQVKSMDQSLIQKLVIK